MSRESVLGLLGFAGNYKKIDYKDLFEPLDYALTNYDLLDLSTDYGIETNLIETIKKIKKSKSHAKLIYKVGCNLTGKYDVNELIKLSIKDIEFFGIERIDSLLSHRPSVSKLKSDTEFFAYILKKFPTMKVGISTNSQSLYENYKKYIDLSVVQLAINPLDYAVNKIFLDLLVKDEIMVQARSILSSGLLSGKYNRKTLFKDNMRSRFHEKNINKKYLKRLDTALKVVSYVQQIQKLPLEMVPNFLYSFFEMIPGVNIVIRGGSTLKQIAVNKKLMKIDTTTYKKVLLKMEREWVCEYV